MRREWIEIQCFPEPQHPTGSLPPCGGSGLKFDVDNIWQCVSGSPSMRREWIEIFLPRVAGLVIVSPSMRREWIEMKLPSIIQMSSTSPSMRREWIEM